MAFASVAPSFKNKTRYTPYVGLGGQISHIATNKSNIKRQCSKYNVLSIKDITLDSKQWKDNSDLRVKTPIPQGVYYAACITATSGDDSITLGRWNP